MIILQIYFTEYFLLGRQTIIDFHIGHMTLMSGLEEGFGITMDTDDIIDFSFYKKGTKILKKYKIF